MYNPEIKGGEIIDAEKIQRQAIPSPAPFSSSEVKGEMIIAS